MLYKEKPEFETQRICSSLCVAKHRVVEIRCVTLCVTCSCLRSGSWPVLETARCPNGLPGDHATDPAHPSAMKVRRIVLFENTLALFARRSNIDVRVHSIW